MVERMQFPCGGWVLTWGLMLSIVGFWLTFLLMSFRWVHNIFVFFVLVFLKDWRVILILRVDLSFRVSIVKDDVELSEMKSVAVPFF